MNDKLNVLIGCEESQRVCQAFRDRGHTAYSCDIQPTRGNPNWHYQGDIMDALEYETGGYFDGMHWDLIILHPDCTAMAVSGNRWYGRGMSMHHKRLSAITWTTKLWNLAKQRSKRVVLENPVSVIFSHLDAHVQYIQPWQFGHGETKKTGLALHNVPELKPTNIVDGREQRIWKMPPGENRKRDRSETFQGISDAFANQWGNL